MAAGLKRLAMLVMPYVFGDVTAFLKHLLRIPILRFLGQPVAALQHQNLEATGGQMARQGAATGSAADDHHIEMGPIGHLQLGGIGQGRNGQGRAGKLAEVGGMGHSWARIKIN